MTRLLRHQAWLVLAAVLIFFTNLGNYALFNEDEPKNAVCGAEMFRRGDVIVPTFYEQLRTDKPILIYWFMLASYKAFGVSEFAARFASSVMAVGTTLLTYHLGRKLYSANVGFLAGLILCTCLLFSAVGRAATPDSFLIFFVTLAFTSYVWVIARQRGGNFSGLLSVSIPQATPDTATPPLSEEVVEPDPNRDPAIALVPANRKFAAPFYAAMGLAVLAKGPVGLVLPSAIILLFLLISFRERDLETGKLKPPAGPWWRRWFLTATQSLRPRQFLVAARGMKLLDGLAIVAAVALPWYLAVGIKTNGAWLQGFLFDHNLGRALSAKENHNGFPFYQLYYVAAILLGCFPWSVFLPVAIYRMWQRFMDGEWGRDSDRLLACWATVWFICFSLASTKLPNYVLPMYPAVALILARYFHDWERDEVDAGVYSFNLCCRAMGAVGILMIIGVYITAFLLFENEQRLALIGFIPIIGAYVAIKFLDREQRTRVMQTLQATALLLAFVIVGLSPPRIGEYQDSPKFIADAKRFAKGAEFEIGTFAYFQPSVLFYAGKQIKVLQSPREVSDFLASHPHAFVITRVTKLNELREELRSDVTELSRHRNFLHRDELILLGRSM